MRTVYVNGEYVSEDKAQISIFDRGFLFADAVYEVTSVIGGKLVDFDAHMVRLERSMSELDMEAGFGRDALLVIHRTLIEKNNLTEGLIYMQISRGIAERDFDFSGIKFTPSLVVFTQNRPLIKSPLAERGQKITLAEDLRWGRADIKSVQLLYSSLTKTRAKKSGADDVWFYRNGEITEGSSCNAYIVTQNNEIITRELSNDILHGITRDVLLRVAKLHQMKVIERAFTLEELHDAKEAFSTSTSGVVNPVVSIDDRPVGDGRLGPIVQTLRKAYVAECRANAV